MPDSPSLVGRERHVRELQHLVDGVPSKGQLMVLSGDAGAGKTALALAAIDLAEAAGVHVAWATCWRSAAAPLSAWTDVLVAATGASLATPQSDPEVDPEGARTQRIESLVDQLVRAVGSRPSLVVIDDLQWADPLSLHAIEVLGRRCRSAGIALLCTVRDEATPHPERLERVIRTSRHLVVPPLSQSELADLAMELTGRPLTRALLARLHDRTGGNVLIAREVLLYDDELAAGRSERRATSAAAIAMFSERVTQVSDPCQRVLQAASVVGRRFRLDVLAEALATDVGDLLDLVGEAESTGLVRGTELGGFEFSHPLVAEACYQAGGLPRRVRLHRDVAEAMERMRDRGISIAAVEIAHHCAHAAAAGVADKAARYAAIAGRDDMEQLAYEDAVRDFGLALRALDLCAPDDETRAQLLLELGDAHVATGDVVAARDAYERAARLGQEHHWPDVFARAALGVGSGPGGFEVPPFDDHQVELLEQAASITTGVLQAHVMARLSVALSMQPREVPRRTALSQQAIDLAREADDPTALGFALASWCDVNPGPDAADERLGAADEILRCAAAVHDTRLELLGRRMRVVALLELGRIDEVDVEIAAFSAGADRLAQPIYSWYVPLWQAMRAAMDGRFDESVRSRRLAESVGAAAHSDNALMLTASQQAMLACELRDSAEAVAFFEVFIAEFPDYATAARPALAYALASTGQIDRARQVLATIDLREYTLDVLGSEFLTTVMMLAQACWLVGRDDHADRLYGLLLPYRSRFIVDGIGAYFAGSPERTLGILAAQRGDLDAARAHFDIAIDEHRRVGSPVLLAGTLRDAADCFDDDVRRAEAAALFADLGVVTGVRVAAAPGLSQVAPRHEAARSVFRREGDVWLVAWDAINGTVAHVPHSKGMTDIARLLSQPGSELHVLDLIAEGPTVASSSTGEAIDATARDRYRARLLEIESDVAEADADGDVERSEQLHRERDALVDELSAAYGLGGRSRRTGDSSERARSAVTQRIRHAISRVADMDAALGHHLRSTIHTGTFCVYEPPAPTDWELAPVDGITT